MNLQYNDFRHRGFFEIPMPARVFDDDLLQNNFFYLVRNTLPTFLHGLGDSRLSPRNSAYGSVIEVNPQGQIDLTHLTCDVTNDVLQILYKTQPVALLDKEFEHEVPTTPENLDLYDSRYKNYTTGMNGVINFKGFRPSPAIYATPSLRILLVPFVVHYANLAEATRFEPNNVSVSLPSGKKGIVHVNPRAVHSH